MQRHSLVQLGWLVVSGVTTFFFIGVGFRLVSRSAPTGEAELYAHVRGLQEMLSTK